MRRLRLAFLFLAAACLCMAAALAVVKKEQENLSEKLIRIHIIANSDSAQDQCVKLKVRDAVLDILEEQNWQNRVSAAIWLQSHEVQLEQTAKRVLVANNFSYGARACLGEERYPTRNYENFSLPAGNYLSLQIVLGEGQGQNWWCVAYPSLCSSASSDWDAQAAFAGITQGERELMTGKTAGVQLRFKFLEWFR